MPTPKKEKNEAGNLRQPRLLFTLYQAMEAAILSTSSTETPKSSAISE